MDALKNATLAELVAALAARTDTPPHLLVRVIGYEPAVLAEGWAVLADGSGIYCEGLVDG